MSQSHLTSLLESVLLGHISLLNSMLIRCIVLKIWGFEFFAELDWNAYSRPKISFLGGFTALDVIEWANTGSFSFYLQTLKQTYKQTNFFAWHTGQKYGPKRTIYCSWHVVSGADFMWKSRGSRCNVIWNWKVTDLSPLVTGSRCNIIWAYAMATTTTRPMKLATANKCTALYFMTYLDFLYFTIMSGVS